MARLLTLAGLVCVLAGIGLAKDDPNNKPFNDATFVNMAANDNMFEIALGKIAESKATNEQVKAFAQRMVTDHTKAEENLRKAAAAAGLTLPTDLNEKHKKKLDEFKNLAGNNFDTDYTKHMIPDHEKAVALFTQASKEAQNPAIKDYAAKTLPTLEEHLVLAKKLNNQK